IMKNLKTLVESQFPHISRGLGRGGDKKSAFTLAEVLITLGIIGVVAAITMPAVIVNINERVNSERQANIAQKVTQAMEQMRAHGLLNAKYASTDAFVDELQKYLKIAKRCDSEHIAECWPTETVTTSDGEEYEVSKAKTGAHLKHKNNKTVNVGLVLADGASLIMTYDENGDNTLDVGSEVKASRTPLPVGGGKMKDFPYTTSVTSAIDFVMDVNGGKGPNSEKIGDKWNDIRSFNGAQFAKGMICDFEVGNLCVKNLGGTYSAVDCKNSNSSSSDYDYCKPTPSNYGKDSWAGAKKACAGLEGMHLATRDELNTIYAHKGEPNVPDTGVFWSSEEDSTTYAWCKPFGDGYEFDIKTYHGLALCVGN
ncbi:prepilin-type N-terminal cleavage/methylation domain-containing protein, partial [bacterium]|nr:prepilin-type N-terminal cleavage/methylation domain-containing protein [bacterium]